MSRRRLRPPPSDQAAPPVAAELVTIASTPSTASIAFNHRSTRPCPRPHGCQFAHRALTRVETRVLWLPMLVLQGETDGFARRASRVARRFFLKLKIASED